MTTAQQLNKAITSYGGVEGVRVATMDSIDETLDIQLKIPGISKLNSFEFDGNSTTTWRAYAIGNGKVINLENSDKGMTINYTLITSNKRSSFTLTISAVLLTKGAILQDSNIKSQTNHGKMLPLNNRKHI